MVAIKSVHTNMALLAATLPNSLNVSLACRYQSRHAFGLVDMTGRLTFNL
jgi:hypothetical protein